MPYVLKHKDLDVAMVQIDPMTGVIEYVHDIYMPEELPQGCRADGSGLAEWWKLRAIPDTRDGIKSILRGLNERTCQSLMLSSYGLSLTDHYWMQPFDREMYWREINFFQNMFSEDLGNILTDDEKKEGDSEPDKMSPASSVGGDMKKKWFIRGGRRYLLKRGAGYYGQQAVNERIAVRLHEMTGWKKYVPYTIEEMTGGKERKVCSVSPIFTSEEEEFVSAYQLLANYKIPNDSSLYEALITQAVKKGMQEENVREYLEYMILTDFILTNTDRHLNNIGFLYDSEKHQYKGMAPLFDTGNSLFFDQDVIPGKGNLLEIKVNSFCKREADMLRYVRRERWQSFPELEELPGEAVKIFRKYTDMPGERAEKIADTIRQKLYYLRLFLSGTKIWKKERFW